MSKKFSCLSEYIKAYGELIKKRCELDARIDFVDTLIKSYERGNVAEYKICYYDDNGKCIKEVRSQDV